MVAPTERIACRDRLSAVQTGPEKVFTPDVLDENLGNALVRDAKDIGHTALR
mgnify:CR=1 FL=1